MKSQFPEFVHEASEDICQREPLAARTRLALMRLEKDVHREGWNSEASLPAIIRFERHREKHFIKARVSDPLTECLTLAYTHHTGGDVGEALALLAWISEQGREAYTEFGGVPFNEDLILSHAGPGWEFYGYALRMEAWTLPGIEWDGTGDPPVPEAVRQKRLYTHPDRIECRLLHLVCRDGLSWSLTRRRRMPPVECVVSRPEGRLEQTGLAMNSLGRMVNATAGNPVPVPRLAEEVAGR